MDHANLATCGTHHLATHAACLRCAQVAWHNARMLARQQAHAAWVRQGNGW